MRARSLPTSPASTGANARCNREPWINTIRLYNPINQGQDHDPKGAFIRRWVPELGTVAAVHIHEPWTMAAAQQERIGCVLGDFTTHCRLWPHRRRPGGAGADLGPAPDPGLPGLAAGIVERHASRRYGLKARAGPRRRSVTSASNEAIQQLTLNLA